MSLIPPTRHSSKNQNTDMNNNTANYESSSPVPTVSTRAKRFSNHRRSMIFEADKAIDSLSKMQLEKNRNPGPSSTQDIVSSRSARQPLPKFPLPVENFQPITHFTVGQNAMFYTPLEVDKPFIPFQRFSDEDLCIDFDQALSNRYGEAVIHLNSFHDYLRFKELSDENLAFWIACRNHEMLCQRPQCLPGTESIIVREMTNAVVSAVNVRKIQASAIRICRLYLKRNAKLEVNVPEKLKAEAIRRVVEQKRYDPSVFRDLKDHVYRLMKQDSYPRYLKWLRGVVEEMRRTLPPMERYSDDEDDY